MAITVPVPDRQVSESGLPGQRVEATATPGTFGGGPGAEQVTQAELGASDSLGKVAAFEKIRADQIAVEDGTAKASIAQANILHDPKTGVLNLQGKNAMGAPEASSAAWAKVTSEIAKGLNGNEQRGAFARVAANMGLELRRTVDAHVSQQILHYDNETANALIKSEQDNAGLAYGDPQRIASALARQSVTLKEYAQRNGLGDESDPWFKQKFLEASSATHEAVIKRMLADGQDVMAQNYLTANKDNIDGQTMSALRPIMREGTIRGAAQRNADDIWNKTDGDMGKAMDMAKKVENPDVRERTQEEIRRMDEDRRRAITDSQDQAYLKSFATIQQRGLRDPSDIRNAIDPATWIQMGPEHTKALLRSGADLPTDGKRYMEFLDLARNPNNLAKLSTAEYYSRFRQYFAPDDQKHADGVFQAASKGDNKVTISKDEMDDTIIRTGIIPGFNPKKPTTADAKAFVTFENSARSEILKWEAAHNKTADVDEKKSILNKLATKEVFVHRTILPDRERPAAVLIGDERGRAYVPIDKIPEVEKKALESAALRMGKTATSDKLQRAYAQVIIGDGDRLKTILAE